MVGGLVEEQQVRRPEEHPGQRQPAALPAGEDRGPLLHRVPGEEERAEDVADLRQQVEGSGVAHRLPDGPLRIQVVPVGAVPGDPDAVPGFPRAGVRRFGAGEQADQGGLAGAVGPDERQSFPPFHREVQVLEDPDRAEPLGDPGERQQDPARARRPGQGEPHPPRRRRRRDAFHPLQQLHPALHLPGAARLVTEPADEPLVALDLRLLFGGPFPQVGDLRRAPRFVGAVGARIPAQPAGADLGDPGHHRVQEEAVVRHQHQPSPMLRQEFQQPVPGLEVEVVRRLVEQDEVVGLDEEPRQSDPHLPALGELLDRPVPVLPGEPEPGEDFPHPGVEFVAAAATPFLFEFAVPLQESRFRRRLRQPLGQGFLGAPLRQQVGERGLHLFGHAAAGEAEPVLGQVADPAGARPDHFALVRSGFPGEDPQDGGLAGAVGADQPDPLAGADPPAHPVEQHLLPVGFRSLDQLDHRRRVLSARRGRPARGADLGTTGRRGFRRRRPALRLHFRSRPDPRRRPAPGSS